MTREAAHPLTEADVVRIFDRELAAFLRRIDDRARWVRENADPGFGGVSTPEMNSAPQAALGSNADGRQRVSPPATNPTL